MLSTRRLFFFFPAPFAFFALLFSLLPIEGDRSK